MQTIWQAAEVPWYPPEFSTLLAVAVAELDESGRLIAANAGFQRLAGPKGCLPAGAPVDRFFIQPDFASLIHAEPGPDGEIHSGLLTFGEYDGMTRSLRARIWRIDGCLRLLAEYDVEELEQLYANILELNREVAESQLKLTQAHLKLQQREARSVALSLTDQLTGVGNRRRLDQALTEEISRAERTGDGLTVIMADLDHFKRINDQYGHDIGDKVLAAFGDLLRRQTRPTDIVARFGGEEFVVLMPHATQNVGVAAAERLRTAVSQQSIAPLQAPVTASFGVIAFAVGEDAGTLLSRVDQALYAAKNSGRNCVVSA